MTDHGRGTLAVFAALLRIREWPKNLFVFAPLLFSGRLDDPNAVVAAVIVAAALCPFSSVVYILNDLRDIPRDRQHPIKRLRPMASGAIRPSAGAAAAVAAGAAGVALLVVAHAPPAVWWLTALYVAISTAYTMYFKYKVIVDVMTIAVGYVLRVLIGGAAIGVYVTHQIILCTFLLAIFLGFSKRRHELTLYPEMFLDHALLLALAVTLMSYILYTVAPGTVDRFGTTALVYSSIFVMFALFRYLFLVHVKKTGNPVEVLYGDRQIVMAIVAWVLYMVFVVYTAPMLGWELGK